MAAHLSGMIEDRVDIRLSADSTDLRADMPADRKAAGIQKAARFLEDVRLPAHQRFIAFQPALPDDGIAGDLISVGQKQQIVHDDLIQGQLTFSAIAQGLHMRLREQREPVQHTLGADLLKDADDDIGNNDAQKEHIAVIAGDEDQCGQDDIDEVEQRHQIVPEDHAVALGRLLQLFIIFTLFPAGSRLLSGESLTQVSI